ncbi:PREDICTED: C4b-binding protein beta chain [Chrysochloris asiatica]|uniref:C4b-binding protein beta chain n=1 Tax=Chrysochloris asiatica TaxID=185453 RepID=A0A9B0T2N8_CHRAS|nr:PREDICTED: C4b-binding protein beta chain [Chrysochloris asiatica]
MLNLCGSLPPPSGVDGNNSTEGTGTSAGFCVPIGACTRIKKKHLTTFFSDFHVTHITYCKEKFWKEFGMHCSQVRTELQKAFRVEQELISTLHPSQTMENCPELPSVDNSIFVVKEVKGQILGTYLCLNGYHMVGKDTLFCNASKEWDAPTPTCRLGHCPDPELFNGEFSFMGPVNVNDNITFQCDDNYILMGSSWSQCLEDHSWAPPFPICKSKDCGPPGNPAHGCFEGSDFKSGSNITYYCEERYRLVGTQYQQCISGEWSSVPPICEAVPLTVFEKALLAFQEDKDRCQAIQNFVQRLKESGLIMEELKYSLEIRKAELEAKRSL